jgi:hypothetical protein
MSTRAWRYGPFSPAVISIAAIFLSCGAVRSFLLWARANKRREISYAGGRSFSVMLYEGGHRSAPCVIAGFAGFVHNRQTAADKDHEHDKDGQYWAVHWNLPLLRAETSRHPEACK